MGNVCGSAADAAEPRGGGAAAGAAPGGRASLGGDGGGGGSASIQTAKADGLGGPAAISIKVAPAPPPEGDEYPEIRAAVTAAQREVKAGARLKFAEHYRLGQVIGTGHYARVQVAMSLKDGRRYAVKIMKKAEGKEALLQQLQNIVKEVAIMRLLSGHPNMVGLEAVLQDAASFYLVMELCNGGELFDQIIRSGHMTEGMAAAKAQALLSFLAHAHAKHGHQAENLLLSKAESGALTLKVIDFGCSTFCVPGKRLCKKFGTPYYVAPEVLWRDYDKGADVWSAGVVLFILLSGRPPFNGRSDEDIVAKVRTGHFRMCPDEWAHVSVAGKALVREMLKLDATARPSAEELLAHDWFRQPEEGPGPAPADGSTTAAGGMSHVVARLEAFAGMSRMKRLALSVLCHTVTDRHITTLKEAFYALDKDGDGHLTPAELHEALRSTGSLAKAGFVSEIGPEALEGLIAASDLYGEGYVDVDEFLAAMLANSNYTKAKDALRRSFDALDQDHDGFITCADLLHLQQQLLGQHHITPALAEEMMSEVSSCIDEAHEGKMTYTEFCSMMMDDTNKHCTPQRRFSLDSYAGTVASADAAPGHDDAAPPAPAPAPGEGEGEGERRAA
ncbi:CPK1 [Scenedesmus sp. PABB004]|nr:CPK1 [Scenedesmus sp. PABB004]